MIKVYSNGNELVKENDAFLQTNTDLACFFYWDAPLLKEVNKKEFAIRVEREDATLLAVKVEPYSLLLFGSELLVEELIDFLMENDYCLPNALCEQKVGEAIIEAAKKYNIGFYKALGMDFMTCDTITEPDCDEVVIAQEKDIDELCECVERFNKDCGLLDRANREHVINRLANFRLIFRDGKIACMAMMVQSSKTAYKISDVYTRNEYRGQKLARRAVNNCKNEIIRKGFIATLNVDQKNPITNHLYTSLGFKKKFSQGEFRKIED